MENVEEVPATMAKRHVSISQILTAALAVQALVLILAWAGLHFTEIDVAWGIGGAPLNIAIGLFGAIATYWIARVITCSDNKVGATLRDHCRYLHAAFREMNWWRIGILAASAGICEELLFRGLLQPWIASFSTPLVGLMVASVLFGLLHYASFIYFLITTVMGGILGAAYWLSDSLLAVVVWHGVYDLIALGVLAKFPRLLGLGRVSR